MDNRTCRSCKYYTEALGSDGYCKHYGHRLSDPYTICSVYQVNEKNENSKFFPASGLLKKDAEVYTDDKKCSFICGRVSFYVSLVLVSLVFFVFLIYNAAALVLLFKEEEISFIGKLFSAVLSATVFSVFYIFIINIIRRSLTLRMIFGAFSVFLIFEIIINCKNFLNDIQSVSEAVVFFFLH